MESTTLRNLVRPLYPIFSLAIGGASVDVMAVAAIIRNLRKGERANIFHAAIREHLRVVCDVWEPFLTMAEEPEGSALDTVVIELNGERAALRWGRYDPATGKISRNRSGRIESMQQDFLYSECFDPSGLPTGTLGYELDDDVIEVGVPQWWLSRIALRRERVDSTEFIEQIASFNVPIRVADLPEPRTVQYIAMRDQRMQHLEQVAEQIRSNVA